MIFMKSVVRNITVAISVIPVMALTAIAIAPPANADECPKVGGNIYVTGGTCYTDTGKRTYYISGIEATEEEYCNSIFVGRPEECSITPVTTNIIDPDLSAKGVMNISILAAAALCIVFIVTCGVLILQNKKQRKSNKNNKKIKLAKQVIIVAIVGLVVAMTAYILLNYVYHGIF